MASVAVGGWSWERTRTWTGSHPIFSKATRATLCRSPVARKPRYCLPSGSHNMGAAAHGQRWDHSAHHIAVSVLFPWRGREIFGFKAAKGAAVLRSLGARSLYQPGSRGHCVVLKQRLWNHSPKLQLVLIYSGWLQFNIDQYWSGCHNSSLRFASKGSNSFDLPNRENWRAYN